VSRPRVTAGLEDFAASLVSSGAFSGLTAAVGDGRRTVWQTSAGLARRPSAKARWSSRWDLASLTKLHVATLAIVLDRRGDLPLETVVGEIFPAAAPRMADISLERLLRHRSGLVDWAPLYALSGGRGTARDVVLSGLFLVGRRRCVYSDLGYILWGWAAERALGEPLERLLRRHVWRPLGMRGCSGPPGDRKDVAECRLDNHREVEFGASLDLRVKPSARPPVGATQDGNARFLGGVCGHAGIFATASDCLALAAEWLRPQRILSREDVRSALAGGGEYGLGWARRRVRGTAGPALGARAFGLVGSTGTSLWIDPDLRRIFLLLGHRRSWADLRPKRRRFHRLAVEALD
jgi:CubicO group peptidase (beta-lactamase class C family)